MDFDLEEFMTDIVDEMRGLLKKDQDFIIHHHSRDTAHTDKKLLKNIVINLLTNAIKFSGEGQPIVIESSSDDAEIKISVSDRGIGIPEDDQEHLFSSFFRGKNATNIQGTGLGLHIIKRYLDLVGGNIKLESRINEGTTFHVTIPQTNNNPTE
jgi:signal transduction histidine kinase